MEDRPWRSPRSDSDAPRSWSIAAASRSGRSRRATDRDHERQRGSPSAGRVPTVVSGMPTGAGAGRAGRTPGLERQAALLDVGQRRQDHRPDQRQDARGAAPGRCPPCRDRAPAGARRSRPPARPGPGRPRSWPPRRTRTAARRRAARGRARSCAARSSARTARSTVEIANSRTRVWPAKSTPSAVASNGPIVNRTVVPARVKTLTSDDRDRDRQRQQGRDPGEPAGTPRRHGARAGSTGDDRDRPEVAADDERAERLDGRDDRLGQRVEPVVRGSVSAATSRARKAASSGSRSSAG